MVCRSGSFYCMDCDRTTQIFFLRFKIKPSHYLWQSLLNIAHARLLEHNRNQRDGNNKLALQDGWRAKFAAAAVTTIPRLLLLRILFLARLCARKSTTVVQVIILFFFRRSQIDPYPSSCSSFESKFVIQLSQKTRRLVLILHLRKYRTYFVFSVDLFHLRSRTGIGWSEWEKVSPPNKQQPKDLNNTTT